MGLTLVFSELQVLLSHLCEKKEKRNIKRDGKKEIKRKGWKGEGITKGRRKERKKDLKN